MKYTWLKSLNIAQIFVLCSVLIGAFTYQFVEHENPCPLCELQRLAMIAISVSLILNMLFGFKARHYALGICSCIFGACVSIRQILLHICPGFPTFGTRVFGMELYTWAFLVFITSIFAIAIQLNFLDSNKIPEKEKKLSYIEKFAISLVLGIALLNFILTLRQCGLGPCSG